MRGRRWVGRGMLLVWTGVVLLALLLPGAGSGLIDRLPFGQVDKVVHFLFFATGGFLAWFSSQGFRSGVWRVLLGIGYPLAIGGLTECLQALVPERGMSGGDFAADLTGIAFGVFVAIVCLMLDRASTVRGRGGPGPAR